MTAFRVIAALAFVALASPTARGDAVRSGELGRLRVTIVDASGGSLPTPARVEVVSADGTSRLPAGAARFPSDCDEPVTRSWRSAPRSLPQGRIAALDDPASGTSQFYTEGSFELALPAGEHHLTVRRGNEYRVHRESVRIAAGEVKELEVPLVRWADMSAGGWFSADDHLHIPRPDDLAAARIARWMQAEDLHVVNLLQMGTFRGVRAARQSGAFGAAGAFQDGATIVASGQENPRAWSWATGSSSAPPTTSTSRTPTWRSVPSGRRHATRARCAGTRTSVAPPFSATPCSARSISSRSSSSTASSTPTSTAR